MELKDYREKIASLSEEELKQRDKYLSDLMNDRILGPVTGYTSIDKPQFRVMEAVDYDYDASKRTVYDVAKEKVLQYIDQDAMSYYGKIISNRELIEEWEQYGGVSIFFDKNLKNYDSYKNKNKKFIIINDLLKIYNIIEMGGVKTYENKNCVNWYFKG